jgi:hypothetical protein
MSNGRKIAIGIAVADAVRGRFLGGATNGAKDFLAWADACGYETTLVSDEDAPVTMAGLRASLETALGATSNPSIFRLIIYFAGHGVIREAEEGLWLLSDWKDELRAVAVEILKRRLAKYGAQQVTIISDACRSLPNSIEVMDLVADAVLKSGPCDLNPAMAVDKFIAAQDGAAAFMLPGADPEDDRCLFTGVLLEGLWGQSPAAYSKIETDKVTSNSLGAYLRAEGASRASAYGLTLNPNVAPTFPEGENYYYDKVAGPAAPLPRPWPSPGSFQTQSSDEVLFQDDASDEQDTSPFAHRGLPPGALGRMSPPRASIGFEVGGKGWDTRRATPPQNYPERQSMTFAMDTAPRRLLAPQGLSAASAAQGRWWRLTTPDEDRIGPTPLLIDLGDNLVAAITSFPHMTADLRIEKRGVSRLIYRPWNMSRSFLDEVEAAFDALDDGDLSITDASDLAVALRRNKHVDPVLGVISAYLYDAVGDIESIRRMAAFYIERRQPIPYDIALLGELPARRTSTGFVADVPNIAARAARTPSEAHHSWATSAMPAATGIVAGYWPWMRQGWAYLEDPSDAEATLILPGLADIAEHLRPARFSTMTNRGAALLARLLDLRVLQPETSAD